LFKKSGVIQYHFWQIYRTLSPSQPTAKGKGSCQGRRHGVGKRPPWKKLGSPW